MQRMRVRYAKRGRLRFTSHRDFSRAFERALVRARIPMADGVDSLNVATAAAIAFHRLAHDG